MNSRLRRIPRDLLSDLCLLCGLGVVVKGVHLIYPPAALIAIGLALVLAAFVVLAPRKHPEKTD